METLQYLNNISFSFINIRTRLKRAETANWLKSVAAQENKQVIDLSYSFCSDDHLLKINREYLNHDYYTDIITFDLSEEENKLEGDIYISIERVKDNSKLLKIKYSDELDRIMVHGLLHLIGYKDKTKSDKALMSEKENYYLSKR
ncbi:MAG: rRNA maturation RNase YbeY [Bacteroidia bacterium]|nr:rRNA maturation RNase YbeY [Bacteroidia bacterium]MCF8426343.1 rRNA maturation RNase YbeY [Bacteroidia bacterium]MCF8445758.1 rRNA maturation RNase YbeY [Bacteroidia bacterium]